MVISSISLKKISAPRDFFKTILLDKIKKGKRERERERESERERMRETGRQTERKK